MSDLIRRGDALKALLKVPCKIDSDNYAWIRLSDAFGTVDENVPSAEPERKKGEWIEISWSETDPNVCCTSYAIQSAKCSICGKCHTTPYLHSLVYFPYCPNCGAEMNRGDR